MASQSISPGQRRWLSLPEVAEMLGLSVHTFRKIRHRGDGPRGVMMGRQLRFHVDDIERWERERREALAELSRHPGQLGSVRLSDPARTVLLDLYSRALTGHGRPLTKDAQAAASVGGVRVTVRRTPGQSTVITSPAGRMELAGLSVAVTVAWAGADGEGQRGEVSA